MRNSPGVQRNVGFVFVSGAFKDLLTLAAAFLRRTQSRQNSRLKMSSMEIFAVAQVQCRCWLYCLLNYHKWTENAYTIYYMYRGFIRSLLLGVNRRLRCLSPPVTKPHIQESSSCNIKYRNRQKQL